MRITKAQLKRIIKEEMGRILNEGTSDSRIRYVLDSVFKRFDVKNLPSDNVSKRSIQGKRKVYDINNGNILLVDEHGEPYISYADERSKNVNTENLFNTLRGDGYKRAGMAVPMSPKNFEKITLGGAIEAEEIRMDHVPRGRDNIWDEEKHLPLIQKAVGRREISDPGAANWDDRKDQIVYLGSTQSYNGNEVIYFKTSNSGKYYRISAN